MGSRIGNITFSGALMGVDPATNHVPPDDGPAQVRFLFENVRSYVTAAGMSVDDVIRVTVHLADGSFRNLVNDEWVAMFPDKESRPARHIMERPLHGPLLVQIELVAVTTSA